MKSNRKYKIAKSKEPEGNKKWLVVLESVTQYGLNTQRVFKGTHEECKKVLEELTKGKRNEQ